jgi:hypothetical protein
LSNAGIGDILNEFFFYSENSNFNSDGKKITELLLVLEPVSFDIPEFEFPLETPPTLG